MRSLVNGNETIWRISKFSITGKYHERREIDLSQPNEKEFSKFLLILPPSFNIFDRHEIWHCVGTCENSVGFEQMVGCWWLQRVQFLIFTLLTCYDDERAKIGNVSSERRRRLRSWEPTQPWHNSIKSRINSHLMNKQQHSLSSRVDRFLLVASMKNYFVFSQRWKLFQLTSHPASTTIIQPAPAVT